MHTGPDRIDAPPAQRFADPCRSFACSLLAAISKGRMRSLPFNVVSTHIQHAPFCRAARGLSLHQIILAMVQNSWHPSFHSQTLSLLSRALLFNHRMDTAAEAGSRCCSMDCA
jgi:hypothetical protein